MGTLTSFPRVPLKYLCSEPVAYGANEPATSYTSQGVRFLRTTDITDDGNLTPRENGVFLPLEPVRQYLLKTGDLLLSRSGTIGRALLFDHDRHGDCAHAGYLVRFRPASSVEPRWLFYFTKSTDFGDQIAADATQSTIANFNGQKFANLMVPLPSPVTRQRTVAFLDRRTAAIDSATTDRKRLITLLREKQRAITTQAITKGLDPDALMKASNLSWLKATPRTWNLIRLKYISPRISGRLVYQPAQYFSDEGVPFLMGNNITERGIVWDDVKRIPPEVNARFSHHALREGDVVTVRVGAPGVTCVVPKESDGLNCGSLMIIRRSPSFDSRWLAYVMNSPVVRAQIDLVQYGAAQEQINITDAVNFLIPTPPREEQTQIADYLDAETSRLDKAVDLVREQIDKLREYRQALITAAVTGKLDLR